MQHLQISLFAMMLAAAGLPLYIHLPRYATAELGLNLSAIGGVLIGLRVLDFVQDPLLGRMVDRWNGARGVFAAVAGFGMALGFLMLFTFEPMTNPIVWLALSLIVVFTSFSLGSVLFYGQSMALAGSREALIRMSAFREAGSLFGVIVAALAPTLIALMGGNTYAVFGAVLSVMAICVWASTRGLWRLSAPSGSALSLTALKTSGGLRLLILSLVNSLPVAMTSTLFLFFVEDKLQLTGLSGLFLILFFLSAGLSVPLWTRLSARIGTRKVLLIGMTLAIVSFIGAAALPPGAAILFAAICIGSGASLGADLVILPALFAATLSRARVQAAEAFGFWSMSAKFALALAAGLMLPLLDLTGFVAGGENSARALTTLTLAYAVVPCILKIGAVWMVARLSHEVDLR
ncbi:MAG: sodium:galactoside symporter [Rhodobacteraceae bacterium]|nr:sodium:galactoside symporter [Paracoccaceae bacterium]